MTLPVRYTRKVRFSDMDCQAHVFNATYFVYFDDAITDEGAERRARLFARRHRRPPGRRGKVSAVRQAPVLLRNLRASVEDRPLHPVHGAVPGRGDVGIGLGF